MDGVWVRGYLRILSVMIPLAVSYGSAAEMKVGGGRGNVGIVDDRQTTR